MAAISKADYRLEYAIELGDRLGPQLELTVGEAADMYAAGFAFSIYRPETGEFQLSRPYATARDFTRNELRIWQ